VVHASRFVLRPIGTEFDTSQHVRTTASISVSAKSPPIGHRATSRSVSSSMSATTRAIRSPWNGGSIRRRSTTCSGASIVSTERLPTSGASSELPSPAWKTCGSPRKIVRRSSGLRSTTPKPVGSALTVNVSP
jgi:hypothetical protein